MYFVFIFFFIILSNSVCSLVFAIWSLVTDLWFLSSNLWPLVTDLCPLIFDLCSLNFGLLSMLTDFWFLAYIFLSSKSAFRFSWGSTFPAFFDGAKIWRHFETAISSMWTNTRTTTIDYQYFSKFPYGQRTKTHPYSHVRTALFYPNLCRQAVCTPDTLLLYKLPYFTWFVHQRGFSCTDCLLEES